MNTLHRALTLSALLLAGCGGGEKDKGTLVIGFSQIGAESSWRTAETKSVRGEAEKRGIELKFSDAQQKQENQIKALNAFIAQQVDVIFLAPVVETGWETVLTRAKQRGIPVILLDRGVDVSDDSLYTTLIGSDFVEEGRLAARWLAKALDGKGRIAELQGTPGSAPAIERREGFLEVLKEYPDMKIVKSQSGEFTRAKGKEVMEAFLKAADEKFDAVFAHNDDMALGAIQAIEEAGFKPGENMLVVSIDAVHAAFEAMIEGTLNCTVECNPLLGPQAMDAALKAVAGEELPKKILVPDKIFDQSVAAEVIKTREY
ncbi:MAG: ABC transporter substrate-binding protein [Planctomycetota bacterium]